MLKLIEKIVFTPTGEVRKSNPGEYYLDSGNCMNKLDTMSTSGEYPIYTKSIELAQPKIVDNKSYWYISTKTTKFAPIKIQYTLDEPIRSEVLKTCNIFETKEEAQLVADQINLLIQEKGYFTLYPESID